MTEDATTATQPECCSAKPAKSRFWLGFFLGLPVYPLILPWIILTIPESLAEAYIRGYAEYIRVVMKVLYPSGLIQ